MPDSFPAVPAPPPAAAKPPTSIEVEGVRRDNLALGLCAVLAWMVVGGLFGIAKGIYTSHGGLVLLGFSGSSLASVLLWYSWTCEDEVRTRWSVEEEGIRVSETRPGYEEKSAVLRWEAVRRFRVRPASPAAPERITVSTRSQTVELCRSGEMDAEAFTGFVRALAARLSARSAVARVPGPIPTGHGLNPPVGALLAGIVVVMALQLTGVLPWDWLSTGIGLLLVICLSTRPARWAWARLRSPQPVPSSRLDDR